MKWIRLQCKMCQCIMSKVVLLKNHLGPNLIIMTHQESNNHNRNSYPHADSPKIILCSIFYIGPLFFFFHDTVVDSWKKIPNFCFLLHTSRVHNISVDWNKSYDKIANRSMVLEFVHYNFVKKIRQQNAFHITSHLRLKFPANIVLFSLTSIDQHSSSASLESAGNFKLKWIPTWKALCYLIFWTKL